MEFGAKSCCLDRHKFPCYWTKGSSFFMIIMNQEALREGNNIGRLMMMNRFGKTPADVKLPSPLPLQPLPVLLMQNKMKKHLQKEAENSPRKIWNNETGTEDVRTHSSEWEENTQVDFKAGNDLQTARENVSSSWGRDLGWKSSACHKAPLLPLQDPENPCKGDEARWRHESPAQLSGVSELLLTKRKMGLKKKNPQSKPGQHFPFEAGIFQHSFQFKFTLDAQKWFFCPLATKLAVCT